jgi:hypothetical protein
VFRRVLPYIAIFVVGAVIGLLDPGATASPKVPQWPEFHNIELRRSGHTSLVLLGESPTADASMLEVRTGLGAGTLEASVDEDGDLDVNTLTVSTGALTTTAAELNAISGIGNTVTATNLNTLTDGSSNADSLHTHGGGLPAGIIMMWSGTVATIPTGWSLCNGAGGTPDLRDRFVEGWTNAVNPGGTGGAASITLTDMPSHSHTAVSSSETHTHGNTGATDFISSHTHSGGQSFTTQNVVIQINDVGFISGPNAVPIAGTLGGSHSHSMTMNSAAGHSHTTTTINNSGSGTSFSNDPAYFEVLYIMKN